MCGTYEDAGTITIHGNRRVPQISSFRTHFVRPDRLLFIVNVDQPDERVLWSKDSKVFEYAGGRSKRLTGGLLEFLGDARKNDRLWFSAIPLLIPDLQISGTYLKNHFASIEDKSAGTFVLTAECIPYAKIQLLGNAADWSVNQIKVTHELGLESVLIANCATTVFKNVSFETSVPDELFGFQPR